MHEERVMGLTQSQLRHMFAFFRERSKPRPAPYIPCCACGKQTKYNDTLMCFTCQTIVKERDENN